MENLSLSLFLLHAPALAVVAPLVAAGLVMMVRSFVVAWTIGSVAVLCTFIAAWMLLSPLVHGDAGEVMSYAFGGWEAPIGIAYAIDGLNAWMLGILALSAVLIWPFAASALREECLPHQHRPALALLLLCLAGLVGITLTQDIFNLYVFLEISSLSTYGLIALGRHRRARLAAFEYLILGTLGATFILIGIGFLYHETGTLNIADLAARLAVSRADLSVLGGVAFLSLGLILKIALFPLHIWLTNAYTYAPSPVAAFLSATATKVSIYVLIRLVYDVLSPAYVLHDMALSPLLLVLAVSGMVVASLIALFQYNAKRMLAFSSVAQLGYIVLGVALVTEAGLAASLTHMANHALAKLTLFMALGCVLLRMGSVRLYEIQGVGFAMPWTMAACTLGALSLVGIPGTAGFISKWMLLHALIEDEQWLVMALVLVASLLALGYMGKLLMVAYTRAEGAPSAKVKEAPLLLLVPLLVVGFLNLYAGFDTRLTAALAESIAAHYYGTSFVDMPLLYPREVP